MPNLLTYSSTITSPAGGTLQLETPGTYRIERTTRDNRQVSHRKVEASNPFVEGSYVVHAVRENVVENISVLVYGTSTTLLRTRLAALTDCFDQIRFTMTFTQGVTETWTCMCADYVIQSGTELQHSYMAIVKANVPRLPKVVIS